MEDCNRDRRAFLKVAAGCGVFILLPVEGLASPDAAQAGQRAYPDDLNAYLKIGEDGRVTCFSGKIEMGQANTIALAQMVAEELEVPVERVDMVMGDTRLCPWDGGTERVAQHQVLRPGAEGCRRRSPRDAHPPGSRSASDWRPPASPRGPASSSTATTPARAWRTRRWWREANREAPSGEAGPEGPGGTSRSMGRALPPGDGRDKVTGKAVFAGDVRLPGLLHGRVLRPPAHGARLLKADLAAARAYPGARVFQDGDFVGVVHPTSDGAAAALAAIKAEFTSPPAVGHATRRSSST